MTNHSGHGNKPFHTYSSCNPTNHIFYGPSGTGKTFHAVYRAVSLVEECSIETLLLEDNKIVMERFHEYQSQGRIELCTFHQSFSYEDFIEGIKPDLHAEKGEELYYTVEMGIFQRICNTALQNYHDARQSVEDLQQKWSVSMLMEEFAEYVQQTLDTKTFPLNESVSITAVEQDAFRYGGENWKGIPHGLRMKFSDLEELYVLNIKNRKELKNVNTVTPLCKHHGTYFLAMAEKLSQFEQSQNLPHEIELVSEPLHNYVIIIDEINRGNISKIFGELITLIDCDKRYGMTHELSLTLPYSKKKFTIPSNLHIIGTMNSVDRSVSQMDTALRRRFTFGEIVPNGELISSDLISSEIDLRQFFITINRRIEALYDRDHMLGHAYFMGVQTKEELDSVMRHRVIPLLKEYFYDDWGKIQLVLGDSSLQNPTLNDSDRFIISEVKKTHEVLSLENSPYSEEEIRFYVNPQEFTTWAYIKSYDSENVI